MNSIINRAARRAPGWGATAAGRQTRKWWYRAQFAGGGDAQPQWAGRRPDTQHLSPPPPPFPSSNHLAAAGIWPPIFWPPSRLLLAKMRLP